MKKQSKAGTPTKFIVMRKEILKDKTLSSTDKIVYARICSFDEYFESAERCGELLGMTAWQVQKSRRKLELSGYIRCIENTGRGKKYQAVYDLPKTVGLSGKNSNSDWKKQQLRVEKSTTLIGKIDNSESKKTHTYNKVENKVENKEENILSKDSIGETPKNDYGNFEINELFDEWESAFDYRPRDTKANRYAAYNLLRNKNIGKEKVTGIIKALPKLQMQTYCVGSVKKVSDFVSLQREWDTIWNMAYREWKKQQGSNAGQDWRL